MSRCWPYPLEVGTFVIAKCRRELSAEDVKIVGVVARVIPPRSTGTVSVGYAVKCSDGSMIQTKAAWTLPVDTSTPDGLDEWLDAMDPDESTEGLDHWVTPGGPPQSGMGTVSWSGIPVTSTSGTTITHVALYASDS